VSDPWSIPATKVLVEKLAVFRKCDKKIYLLGTLRLI